MECPYLKIGREESICAASTRSMKPGEQEMARYCKMEEHYCCPILLAHTLRRGSSRRLFWAAVA